MGSVAYKCTAVPGANIVVPVDCNLLPGGCQSPLGCHPPGLACSPSGISARTPLSINAGSRLPDAARSSELHGFAAEAVAKSAHVTSLDAILGIVATAGVRHKDAQAVPHNPTRITLIDEGCAGRGVEQCPMISSRSVVGGARPRGGAMTESFSCDPCV
eukprot:911035-Prymnesium_polylepis.1